MKSLRPLFFSAICLASSVPALTHAQVNGPTPYPDAKNEAAWPGKGPIRSFGWILLPH